MFWSTDDALIVIDRTIFLTYSATQMTDPPSMKLVEHNLFDPATTLGIGFKSKDMRDQFNDGLARMCERGDHLTLLLEYGVEFESGDESKAICETATAGTSSGSGRMRSFI